MDWLVQAQPGLSDRVALRLLFEMALRKNELRQVQFKHFDLGRRRLMVFGKGGTVIPVPIPTERLRLEIEKLMLERQPDPREFLLYQRKRGALVGKAKQTGVYEVGTLAEYPLKAFDANGMQRWWKRCVEEAGIPYLTMHAARHTAITDFLRFSGNLKLAQQLARHKDISTTANIYAHLDDMDLEAALRRLHGEE